MQPAMKKDVPVRVKNSYNPDAAGTIISHRKTETDPLVTAITYKRDIKMMDIQSTQMLGAYGFLAKVFGVFEARKLSVDVLASSEVSISLTLDKKQNMEDIQLLMNDLNQCAEITLEEGKSILTLITDVERSSQVLATVFRVFAGQDISVEMMSQGASKVNISFILKDSDLNRAMLELHKCFFEDECSVPIMTKQASLQANETLMFKA
jgi:aspartate kinase